METISNQISTNLQQKLKPCKKIQKFIQLNKSTKKNWTHQFCSFCSISSIKKPKIEFLLLYVWPDEDYNYSVIVHFLECGLEIKILCFGNEIFGKKTDNCLRNFNLDLSKISTVQHCCREFQAMYIAQSELKKHWTFLKTPINIFPVTYNHAKGKVTK